MNKEDAFARLKAARSSGPTSGGSGFVARELAVARGLASCRGDDARIDEAEAELTELQQSCEAGWRYVAELEEERARLQAEIERLRAALQDVADMAGWHTDDEADPKDTSPEDAVAHVNGLIRQTCWSVLGGPRPHE